MIITVYTLEDKRTQTESLPGELICSADQRHNKLPRTVGSGPVVLTFLPLTLRDMHVVGKGRVKQEEMLPNIKVCTKVQCDVNRHTKFLSNEKICPKSVL